MNVAFCAIAHCFVRLTTVVRNILCKLQHGLQWIMNIHVNRGVCAVRRIQCLTDDMVTYRRGHRSLWRQRIEKKADS